MGNNQIKTKRYYENRDRKYKWIKVTKRERVEKSREKKKKDLKAEATKCLKLTNLVKTSVTNVSARQNEAYWRQMKRRSKESGRRLIPVESRAKKRRPLPRTSDMTTPQVMLHGVAELAELGQRGVIVRSLP